MEIQLSEGAIVEMCSGNTDISPVLQVADMRLVNTQNGVSSSSSERYRLLLSDGVYLQQGMLATQRNELIKSGKLQKTSVVQLTQAVCNYIQGRPIIIIIDLEVIKETYHAIGEPTQYRIDGGRPTTPQVPSPINQTGMMPVNAQHVNPHPPGSGPTSRPPGSMGALQQPKMERGAQSYGGSFPSNQEPGRYTANNAHPMYSRQEFAVGNSGNAAVGSPYGGPHNVKAEVSRPAQSAYLRPQQPAYHQPPPMYMNRGPTAKNEAPSRIIPIAALNPYQGRWTIKARVTSKSDLRHYNNQRGEGKVFSFDLLDSDGGEIRVTCFNAVADQFYGQIEAGKVYMISKGSLKPAQRNFNHLANDHEIVLDISSSVQLCFDDDSSIPRQNFNFRTISDIEGLDNNTVVDVIGIVSSISPSSSLMRKNGTETLKRTLQLKDTSGKSVELTLWGNFCNAEGQTLQNLCDSGSFPVLAVKSGRVYEFNGKGVGTLSNSQLFIDPDHPEAQRLREWFDMEGRNIPFVSISRESASLVRTDVRKTISQIKDEKLGTSEKPDWITVCATISFMKMENFYYPACPLLIGDRQCNKKVTNNGDGKWRCDRCDKSVDECDYRYILQFQIQDHTALTWVTSFQECGEEILGLSAKDLFLLKYEQQDEDKFAEIVRGALFHKYILKLKVKEETFNDEQRVKSTVVKAERMNFVNEFRSLFDTMEKLKGGADSGGGFGPKSENVAPNIGINTGFSGREMGIPSNNNTNQYANQYSGGYNAGANASYNSCSSCGGMGHNSANCPSFMNGPGQGQGLGACFKCHKYGHLAQDCPGLSAVPPAHGGVNIRPARYGGGIQRQYV